MQSFKSCLLILALYFCSSSFLFGQDCGAAITTTVGTDPECYGFQLQASPTGPGFTYRWLKEGVEIFGATDPAFTVPSSGIYSVVVSGAACATDTSETVEVKIVEEEALFNANNKEPMFDPLLCNIPVKLTLENESTGENLTYAWEITRTDGNPAQFLYIEGTDSTSENPVLQFNEKGQYTVKLTIQGACYDPANPEGPDDPIDPDNPDAERDGRYVHEEQVVIVYPQVQPQGYQACEEPGQTITLRGNQLATFDLNLGQLDPASISWEVLQGEGVIISDSTVENPDITFPATGSYVLSVRFANNCEFSDAIPGSAVTEINVTFFPLPAAPVLATEEVFICEGATYTITPTATNPNILYNFYRAPTGGSPANTSGPQQSFSVGPVAGREVFYVASFENGCESQERTMFTINVASQDIDNTIGSEQSICAETQPATLTGTDVDAGTVTPIYLWESRLEGATTFTAAPTTEGANDQQNYTPPVLSETTIFRRTVTFEGCDTPNFSNEITIEVLPIIEPSENLIEVDNEVVCRGNTPTFTGNIINGNIEYVWQSSTTSETTGFINAVPADGSDNTNGATFTPAFVTQPTWFRRVARYANSNCALVPSNEVILITIDELPQAPIVESQDVTTCAGSSAELIVLTDSTATSAITYLWYTQLTEGEPIGSGSPFFTPPLSEDATFYVEAVNANECVSVRRTAVRVKVVPISADAGRDTTIIQGQTIQLKATGGTSYKWTPSTGLNNDTLANPLARPNETTTYTVTVSNGNNCEAIDEVTITVLPRIVIVNTFSPNQDGINEVWEIQNIENYPEATVEIYNRYGAPVFKSSGYSQPWDGTHNGDPLPLATYYYVIRLKQGEDPFTGSVTIIK